MFAWAEAGMRPGHCSSLLLLLQRHVLDAVEHGYETLLAFLVQGLQAPQSHPLDLLLGLSLLLLARRPLLSGHPRPAL
jgi:hypothetical protein